MNPYEIEFSGKVHCKYCNIPIEVWSEDSFLETYKGNACKLYDKYTGLIHDKKITRCELANKCVNLFKEFGDVTDYLATFCELIQISKDLGELPDNF